MYRISFKEYLISATKSTFLKGDHLEQRIWGRGRSADADPILLGLSISAEHHVGGTGRSFEET